MLIACFIIISMLYIAGQCQNLQPQLENDQKLNQCIIGILDKYYSEHKDLTYVSMDSDDEELLKMVHLVRNLSVYTRNATQQSFFSNQGYLVTAKNVTLFTEYFENLIKDPTWNPLARFLIVINSLQEKELRVVFDVLLRTHVINVLLMNGTVEGNLYTYNPFNEYACGRYYSDVISYGLCSQATHNVYPNKLVNGLKNCTFRASLAHRPPFAIDPLRSEGKKALLGTEEYIFKVLSEKEQFQIISDYSYNGELFSTVAPNMTAIGPMTMLQKNETDIIFGGMMMVASRAQAFTYLCGYHDYNDELRFAVKAASLVPIWKTVYIEFDSTVWMLLLVSLIIYSILMILLLRKKDKSHVPLELLDNLLLHGRHFRWPMTLKCILIIWVWFAYLINTFYQSSLVSLTTNPSKEYQVSDEAGILKFKFKPCFSPALRRYITSEIKIKVTRHTRVISKGCNTTLEAMTSVSKTENLYTLVPNYVYLYNEQSFNDNWGKSTIYYFDKPYTKFLFGFYFYKGFPIPTRLRLNAMRMRENGMADKSLNDQYFARKLKQRFSKKEFEVRFTLPWYVYVVGCTISTISFVVEILLKYPVPKVGRDSSRNSRSQAGDYRATKGKCGF